MQTVNFVQASNIITWNKWFLTILGLWPLKVNQSLFIFFSVYMIIYCVMGVRHLIKYYNQPERIVANLTDNILLTMILGKMFICKRSCKIMAKFLKAIENDFLPETYSGAQEKMAFLYYNHIGLTFIKVSISISTFTAILYYFRTFFNNWSAMMSGNFTYELPYPVHPFFEIKDMTTYLCICIYLMLTVLIIICGYAGPDAFVLSMALHVCGQFAALSCKIDDLLKDRKNYRHHIINIVSRHHHLITLAEILENNFNMIFLQQTLGTIFLLCLTVYHSIANSKYDETNVMSFISYILYMCCVLCTILAYCYIGECLITESAGLRDAFCNSDWYNNPPSYTKLLSICITRSEKPLMFTAGKFYTLSLNTFTNIVKSSMAYLSILRNFV
ncbi:odorant receptor 4-like [Anoplolepis gracilipes]|uniref:odorant receptor 4-like n=1 Tax=Anoplolepis gracilipes TaxID=354296 RepID=UPI003BA04060